jgi:hypothetical protein
MPQRDSVPIHNVEMIFCVEYLQDENLYFVKNINGQGVEDKTVESFTLEDAQFSADNSTAGVVPERVDSLSDDGIELVLHPDGHFVPRNDDSKVAKYAEYVFFTQDGIFAHNVSWRESPEDLVRSDE